MDTETSMVVANADTRAESARVESGYESLSVDETKVAFTELDALLSKLAITVVQSLDQMVPQLAAMQSLLSQRGKERKKVLKQAGVPSWSAYATTYAKKLDCSFRTIQDHITGFRRTGKSGPFQSPKTGQNPKQNRRKKSEPWHADAKDSRALAEAQLAINDLILAYEAGADMAPAYQQYKDVAVSPSKLDAIFEASASNSKTELDAEVKRRLVPVVETAERYIRFLEGVVHSQAVTLTDERRKMLQKPMEEWRSILRYARGVQAGKAGKAVSTEKAPAALEGAA